MKRRKACLRRAKAKAEFNERVLRDPEGNAVENNWHHLELLELTQLNRFLLYEAAREHAKTEIGVTGNVLFEIGANPNVRVLIISDVHAKSKKRCELLREYVNNSPEYRAEFPHVRIARKDGDEWFTLERDAKVKEPTVTSTYAGAPISGGRWDLIICDDLVNLLENSLTPEQRDKLRKWFYRDVMNSVAPGGRLLMLGTPQHDEDLHSVVEEDDRFHVAKYPAVDEEDTGWGGLGYREKNAARGIDPESPDAACLWPQMHNRKSHEGKKRNDPDTYLSQQQLQAVPPSGLMYRRPLIDPALERGKRVRPVKTAPQFLGLDPGYGKRAALLAIQERPGDRVEVWGEYSFTEQEDDDIAKVVAEHCKTWGVLAIYVDAEDPGLAATVGKHLENRGLDTEVVRIPFNRWKRLAIKATRWMLSTKRLSIRAETTTVYRPGKVTVEKSILRTEIRNYARKPGTDDEAAKSDDHGPDALAAYMSKWVEPWLEAMKKQTEGEKPVDRALRAS